MHYIGGGTEFPFQLLRKSCDECRADQPIRVVISDQDFDSNSQANPDNRGVFLTAATMSAHWILLLHHPDPAHVRLYRSLGAKVVVIDDFANFPLMATNLAHRLFPQEST